MGCDEDALVTEQMAYYRARAPEYDKVYAERADMRELLNVADDLPIAGDVLELACGTGQWTRVLAERARSVTAVDAAEETLAVARTRTGPSGVRFVRADVFSWQPTRRYDTVFFAFWLSHVPPSRLPAFWDTVAAALAPGGRVVFIDDGPEVLADEQVLTGQPSPAVLRTVGAGDTYRIVKVFHDPATLTGTLAELGWSATVSRTGTFIIGVAEPS